MTIATHNVGDTLEHRVPVSTIVDVHDLPPDVLLLQEVRHQGHMIALSEEFRRRSGRAYVFAYCARMGLGILVDGSISRSQEFAARASEVGYGAFGATVTGSFGTLDVVSVHLDPVRKSRGRDGFTGAWTMVAELAAEVTMPTVRSRMVRELHPRIQSWARHPLVLGGDFNTIPQSTMARFMSRHYRDALRGTGDYHTGTYWKIRGPEPRVDFLYLSPGLSVEYATVVRRKAGDHYPVRAVMGVGTAAGRLRSPPDATQPSWK